MTSPTTTILFISNPSTTKHHRKDKDKSVYLSYEEKTFVKKAVKTSPKHPREICCATFKILTTPSTSPQEIRSVSCLKRAAWHPCLSVGDVEADDTLGSLSRLSDKIWFKTAINTMLASVWTFSKLTASDGNS